MVVVKINNWYKGILGLKSSNLGLNLINMGLGSLACLFGAQWANSELKGGILGLKGGKLEAQMSQLGAQIGPAWGSNKPT